MVTFVIEVAGYAVEARVQFETTVKFCEGYLTEKLPELAVTVTPEDTAAEERRQARTDAQAGIPPSRYPVRYLETVALQRKLSEALLGRNVLLFHGSAVAVDGQAYLFAAKSGTGKSTHTALWRQMLGRRAVMVNDDKPFLRCGPEGILVCGSPWNGKHRLGENVQVPLKAVCALERGEKNEIREIAPREALPMLLAQSARPERGAQMGKYFDLLDLLTKNVRFYRLRCNMAPEAAEVSYRGMR